MKKAMAEAKRFERTNIIFNTTSSCHPCVIFPHRYVDFKESVFNMNSRMTGRVLFEAATKKNR